MINKILGLVFNQRQTKSFDVRELLQPAESQFCVVNNTIHYLVCFCVLRTKIATLINYKLYLYSVCHGFRLMKQDYYFWVNFDYF